MEIGSSVELRGVKRQRQRQREGEKESDALWLTNKSNDIQQQTSSLRMLLMTARKH